ncbi:hypothetical protein B0H14DRAFT_3468174 [Mycena olivaceomarginata]|nr:hypothetical protein B0H14DRAFT_3468174 [Mycena olivaceomarginata]
MASPAFPPELELEIFMTTAIMHDETIPILIRVARRVLTWIKPLLYKTLAFRGRDKRPLRAALQSMQGQSPKFIRQHVRHIFTLLPNEELGRDEDICTLLGMCRGVQDLVLWILTPEMLPFLPPQLRRLSLPMALPLPSRTDIKSGPFLSSLTHLHVHIIRGQYAWIGDLPCLTHLAVSNPRDAIRPFLHNWLRESKDLQILVLVFTLGFFSSQFIASQTPQIDDPRVVLMRMKNDIEETFRDWKSGIVGGRDLWVYAEEFLAIKQNDPSIIKSPGYNPLQEDPYLPVTERVPFFPGLSLTNGIWDGKGGHNSRDMCAMRPMRSTCVRVEAGGTAGKARRGSDRSLRCRLNAGDPRRDAHDEDLSRPAYSGRALVALLSRTARLSWSLGTIEGSLRIKLPISFYRLWSWSHPAHRRFLPLGGVKVEVVFIRSSIASFATTDVASSLVDVRVCRRPNNLERILGLLTCKDTLPLYARSCLPTSRPQRARFSSSPNPVEAILRRITTRTKTTTRRYRSVPPSHTWETPHKEGWAGMVMRWWIVSTSATTSPGQQRISSSPFLAAPFFPRRDDGRRFIATHTYRRPPIVFSLDDATPGGPLAQRIPSDPPSPSLSPALPEAEVGPASYAHTTVRALLPPRVRRTRSNWGAQGECVHISCTMGAPSTRPNDTVGLASWICEMHPCMSPAGVSEERMHVPRRAPPDPRVSAPAPAPALAPRAPSCPSNRITSHNATPYTSAVDGPTRHPSLLSPLPAAPPVRRVPLVVNDIMQRIRRRSHTWPARLCLARGLDARQSLRLAVWCASPPCLVLALHPRWAPRPPARTAHLVPPSSSSFQYRPDRTQPSIGHTPQMANASIHSARLVPVPIYACVDPSIPTPLAFVPALAFSSAVRPTDNTTPADAPCASRLRLRPRSRPVPSRHLLAPSSLYRAPIVCGLGRRTHPSSPRLVDGTQLAGRSRVHPPPPPPKVHKALRQGNPLQQANAALYVPSTLQAAQPSPSLPHIQLRRANPSSPLPAGARTEGGEGDGVVEPRAGAGGGGRGGGVYRTIS